MNLVLRRNSFCPEGVFGILMDSSGNIVAFTLEHAYPDTPDPLFLDSSSKALCRWTPKLMDGEYLCKRGVHRLESMKTPFETFEITSVPGHTNILFHTGNYNDDSAGCVLLGTRIEGIMLASSRIAFGKFMQLLYGDDSFNLSVKS